MEINSEALTAALKMAGQDTADMDKMLRTLRLLQTIQTQGANPQTMMALLAQYNPKYAAMATLVRALQIGAEQQADAAKDAQPAQSEEQPSSEPFVQYNHF